MTRLTYSVSGGEEADKLHSMSLFCYVPPNERVVESSLTQTGADRVEVNGTAYNGGQPALDSGWNEVRLFADAMRRVEATVQVTVETE